MKIGIIADVHANLEAFQAVLNAFDKHGVDSIVHLGDIAGYNANPNECIDLMRARGIESVLGNHDAAACGLEDPWFFRSAAKKAVEWTSERLTEENRCYLCSLPEELLFNCRCLGVHGSPTSRDDYIIDWLDAMRQLEYLNGREVSICFFGHSHKPALFSEKGALHRLEVSQSHTLEQANRYFINPGAVGQPRDKDWRACYGILDVDALRIDFYRVEYDIDTACRKVLEGGLPEDNAKRLRRGK